MNYSYNLENLMISFQKRSMNLMSNIHDAAKPFLKWVGGKTQLIPELEKKLPLHIKNSREIQSYIEPFVGGGAFFFYLSSVYKIFESVLIDVNPEVYLSYNIIKEMPEELICELKNIENTYLSMDVEKRDLFYYKIRTDFNSKINEFNYKKIDKLSVSRASQLIFLNKTCFNGLFRQNKKGEFNVPIGKYANPTICNEKNIRNCSNALQNTTILLGDFSLSQHYIKDKTLLYLDPPYRPLSKTSNFSSYSKDGFDDNEQIRLAKFCDEVSSDKNVNILLSNSDPKNENPSDTFFDDIYANFHINTVKATRLINSNSSKRGSINELLITNYN